MANGPDVFLLLNPAGFRMRFERDTLVLTSPEIAALHFADAAVLLRITAEVPGLYYNDMHHQLETVA